MSTNCFINNVNFHLVLTNHIVLKADSKEAETLLELLESDDTIPETVTWIWEDGFKCRLFQVDNVDEVIGCHEINIGKVRLYLNYGFNNCVYMPPFKPSGSKFKWVAGKTLKDMEPAPLPKSALSFLRCMAYFTYLDERKEHSAMA